jgi:hypothetical protein
MLIFLDLLAAEQCVAVNLAADLLSRANRVAKFRCLAFGRPKRPAERLSVYSIICIRPPPYHR